MNCPHCHWPQPGPHHSFCGLRPGEPFNGKDATHTPTPWTATVPPSSMLTCRQITGPNSECVALIGWRDFSEGQDADLANAALIVRAVNAHDELVAALRCIANQSIGDDWTPEQAIAFVKQHARAALAKAETP